MIVQKAQLNTLLQIEALSQEAARLRRQLEELRSGLAVRALEDERVELAGRMTTANALLDELTTELARAEADLKLVENRIGKDKSALNSTSSSKDATGLQHELATLEKRKSDLEDAELELLERVDAQKKVVESLIADRARLITETEALTLDINAQAEATNQKLAVVLTESQQLEAGIESELLETYRVKSRRGLAIGRLVKLTCSACNMGLTSAAFREISGAAPDQLVTCPECSAILVRED